MTNEKVSKFDLQPDTFSEIYIWYKEANLFLKIIIFRLFFCVKLHIEYSISLLFGYVRAYALRIKVSIFQCGVGQKKITQIWWFCSLNLLPNIKCKSRWNLQVTIQKLTASHVSFWTNFLYFFHYRNLGISILWWKIRWKFDQNDEWEGLKIWIATWYVQRDLQLIQGS